VGVAPSLIDRYRDRLPVGPGTPVVTLGEGGTPLLRAERLSERLGLELWLKFEGVNPTGSFKDRGMTVAISKAVEEGAGAVVCASTGNTAASAAAYAARAGLRAVVLQPAGAVALGKLSQALALGARLLEVRGSFDEALAAARELAERGTHALVNSLNPYRLEGQKTAAFEIVEELGRAPDVLALPYGGGGNTRAYARGFAEEGAGEPAIVAGEAADRPATAASAIRIAEPAHAVEVGQLLARPGSRAVALSDEAILDAWRLLAREEGLFCEPASAAGLAALAAGGPERGSLAVCVVTGHGLKDPETASRLSSPPVQVDPDPDAIAAAAEHTGSDPLEGT
jgi:threonine synthase